MRQFYLTILTIALLLVPAAPAKADPGDVSNIVNLGPATKYFLTDAGYVAYTGVGLTFDMAIPGKFDGTTCDLYKIWITWSNDSYSFLDVYGPYSLPASATTITVDDSFVGGWYLNTPSDTPPGSYYVYAQLLKRTDPGGTWVTVGGNNYLGTFSVD